LNLPVGELGDPDRIIEEIAAGFGVPITKMLANDPNRANAETGDAGWLRDTILPYCRLDEEQLNAKYLPLWDLGEDAVLAYDNPVPKNEQADADRRVKYVAGGIVKPNEARAELGLDEVEGGDTLLVPSGVVPIGQAGVNPFAGMFAGATVSTAPDAAQPGADAPQGTTEGAPATDAPTSPGAAQDIQTTEATVLNGAQVTAAASIVQQVTAGELPRDSGVAMLQAFFNLTPEKAEQVMGSAGNPKVPTTPNPNPAADATAAQAAEIAAGQAGKPEAPEGGDDEEDAADAKGKALSPRRIKSAPNPNPTALIALLRKTFAEQLRDVLAGMKAIQAIETKDEGDAPKQPDLPDLNIDLKAWNDRLSAAAAPIIEGYLRDAAKFVTQQLNLSPDVWGVVDAKLPQAAQDLALKFAQSTNQTTSMQLDEALADLRDEIQEGIEVGDPGAKMTERVQDVFDQASDQRAETIARTEASRARHDAELRTARASGVVKSKSWLASGDACQICEALAAGSANGIPLDKPYGSSSYGPIDAPPGHVNCTCSQTLNLNDEYQP
jgi:hypothetical protein